MPAFGPADEDEVEDEIDFAVEVLKQSDQSAPPKQVFIQAKVAKATTPVKP